MTFEQDHAQAVWQSSFLRLRQSDFQKFFVDGRAALDVRALIDWPCCGGTPLRWGWAIATERATTMIATAVNDLLISFFIFLNLLYCSVAAVADFGLGTVITTVRLVVTRYLLATRCTSAFVTAST